jgi:DNA polymerase-4
MMDEASDGRWVIHADLDAFFASAEVLRHPELAGLPVIVGGTPTGRGVVCSATYAARRFGVRSAMPMAQALRLCPDVVVLPVDGAHYGALAERFVALLREFSPLVEVVSIDEAYLDASGSERLFGGPVALAQALKRRVSTELGLTVSLGVAGNRLVAKIASDLDKPDGLRVVPHGAEAATLAPLPIERLPGVGPRASARLRALGVTTCAELAAAPDALLALVAGASAAGLRRRARGESDTPVRAEREERKSLGHERTFSADRRGPAELERPLYQLCEETGAALRTRGLAAGTLTLKLRYHDFATLTRQLPLEPATDAHQTLFEAARELLAGALRERDAPVRLIGVRASGLAAPMRQLTLFEDRSERTRRLNAALDRLADRAGRRVLAPARYADVHRRLDLDKEATRG